eukprot:TRINITY_DN5372_c0_g3_i1.p1 TRINITY_DN5372_c0_g3~~TRINITY_DN5372_c0_g3_i1.p1  ORF type:complete len:569 (+),score=105.77 TRINITY_DN5372_c0_g3_i1:769-2475(+)
MRGIFKRGKGADKGKAEEMGQLKGAPVSMPRSPRLPGGTGSGTRSAAVDAEETLSPLSGGRAERGENRWGGFRRQAAAARGSELGSVSVPRSGVGEEAAGAVPAGASGGRRAGTSLDSPSNRISLALGSREFAVEPGGVTGLDILNNSGVGCERDFLDPPPDPVIEPFPPCLIAPEQPGPLIRLAASPLEHAASLSSTALSTSAPLSSPGPKGQIEGGEGSLSRQGESAVLWEQQPIQERAALLEEERVAAERVKTRERRRSQERFELISGPTHSLSNMQRLDDLGIAKLIEDIEEGDAATKKSAAYQLRMLAKYSEENRGLIADAGGVEPLANLLCDEDPAIRAEAVIALLNLSIHNANKRSMPANGAVEPLVEVMKCGDLETRENAAATLFSLSIVDDNKIIIGGSGAIPPLTEILRNGSMQGKRDACKAIFNLSILSTNKWRIIEAGAVQPLVDFLEDPGGSMAEKAVSVLANLATLEEGRRAIAEADEGIGGLVEVVEAGSPRGKENAAAALWQLARNNKEYRSLILREVVIPPLVNLSQSGTPRAKEKAAMLLKVLRGDDRGG